MKVTKSITNLLLLFAMFLFSCKKNIPEDEIITPIVNGKGIRIVDSVKGVLLFHENFQNWKRDGYTLPVLHNCETDLMTSCTTISYLPKNVQVIYDTLTVNYSLIYFAVNPECGNDAGTSTPASDVSTGYVALQAPIDYTCFGHTLSAGAKIITSAIPSVSVVSFSMSYSHSDVDYMLGITLWKKGINDSDFVKVKDFGIQYNAMDCYDTIVQKKITGQVFSTIINEENIQLQFTCIWPGGVAFNTTNPAQLALLKNNNPALYPVINRDVRIHDLKVWSLKK